MKPFFQFICVVAVTITVRWFLPWQSDSWQASGHRSDIARTSHTDHLVTQLNYIILYGSWFAEPRFPEATHCCGRFTFRNQCLEVSFEVRETRIRV